MYGLLKQYNNLSATWLGPAGSVGWPCATCAWATARGPSRRADGRQRAGANHAICCGAAVVAGSQPGCGSTPGPTLLHALSAVARVNVASIGEHWNCAPDIAQTVDPVALPTSHCVPTGTARHRGVSVLRLRGGGGHVPPPLRRARRGVHTRAGPRAGARKQP